MQYWHNKDPFFPNSNAAQERINKRGISLLFKCRAALSKNGNNSYLLNLLHGSWFRPHTSSSPLICRHIQLLFLFEFSCKLLLAAFVVFFKSPACGSHIIKTSRHHPVLLISPPRLPLTSQRQNNNDSPSCLCASDPEWKADGRCRKQERVPV